MCPLSLAADPPAPKVSADALRLRVAKETVQTLRTDAEEAPDVVCTIEASIPKEAVHTKHCQASTCTYHVLVRAFVFLRGRHRTSQQGIEPRFFVFTLRAPVSWEEIAPRCFDAMKLLSNRQKKQFRISSRPSLLTSVGVVFSY